MVADADARWSRTVGAAQTIWAVVVLALWVIAVALLPVDPDYTSGELLDHVLAWRGGESLYSDPTASPYRVLNYPPTILALVRGLSATGIPTLLAGRIVGTIGVMLALVATYRWIRDDGTERWAAAAIVAVAAASFPLMYSAGQFHLEGFALAATVSGYRYASRTSGRELVIAGALLAMACLIKHTQVIPALVALSWVASRRGRNAMPIFGAFVGTGVVGALIITAAFGPNAWVHLITFTVGSYSLDNLVAQLTQHVLPWIPIALIAIAGIRRDNGDRASLRGWYLIGTTLWLLSLARSGSGFQYVLDWQVAALCCAAPTLSRWLTNLRQTPAQRHRSLAFAAYLLVADATVAGVLAYDIVLGRRTEQALTDLCPLLPGEPAATPTEFAGAARACGGRAALHPFIMANLTARHLWDEGPFVRDLERGRYSVVLLPFDPQIPVEGVHQERWSPVVLSTLATRYRTIRESNGWWVLGYTTSLSHR